MINSAATSALAFPTSDCLDPTNIQPPIPSPKWSSMGPNLKRNCLFRLEMSIVSISIT